MEPTDPHLWNALEASAARRLSPDFAHQVLTRARTVREDSTPRSLLIPFFAAAACLVITIFLHEQVNSHREDIARREWQAVAYETDTIGDL